MAMPPHPGTIRALILMAVLPLTAAAQSKALVGVVRDSVGSPIPLAEISVSGRKVQTDSLGRFYMAHTLTDSLHVNVRRLGYESVQFALSADEADKNSLDVVLRRVAAGLDAVNVSEMELRATTFLRGFDERKAQGLGVFVGKEEIEKRNTRHLLDVLRTQRGVSVSGRSQTLKFAIHQSKNCTPMIFLDGQRAPGLELDAIDATDLEGVELYQTLSVTPPQFHKGNVGPDCGTIVIWTKRPKLDRP